MEEIMGWKCPECGLCWSPQFDGPCPHISRSDLCGSCGTLLIPGFAHYCSAVVYPYQFWFNSASTKVTLTATNGNSTKNAPVV